MNTVFTLSVVIPTLIAVLVKVSHYHLNEWAATQPQISTEPTRLVAFCLVWIGWLLPLGKYGIVQPVSHTSHYVTRNHTLSGNEWPSTIDGYFIHPSSRVTELLASKDSKDAQATLMCAVQSSTAVTADQQLADNAAFFFVLDHLRASSLEVSANGISGIEAQYGFRDAADKSLVKVFTLRVEDTFECRDSGRLDASAVWNTMTISNALCMNPRTKQTKSWVVYNNCTEAKLSIDTVSV